MPSHGAAFTAALVAAALLAGCAGDSGSAQRAGIDLDNPDKDQSHWVEDAPPAPPAYDLKRLIDVATPRGSSVKVGIDPKTITINPASGVVRYVVVARGMSAVNAMYEGIRCSTGQFRIYARQVKGQPWEKADDSAWRGMDEQTGPGVLLRHPQQLAQGGLCDGPAITATPDKMAQLLRSSELRPDLYQYR
ncbi:MAG: CNP1-like family protein [Burkholderiaceae bacterium]|nr:CNP1-like family protein [Burkholderiaceae bacterium]